MTDNRSLVRVPFVAPSPLLGYRPAPGGRHTVHDDLVLIAYGGPGPDFNVAVVFGPAPVDRLFSLAGGFFDPGGYAIVVESDVAPRLEEQLLAEGWVVDEEERAMLLTPIPSPAPPLPGLDIQAVTTEARFQDFMALAPGTIDWVPSLEAAQDADVAMFVGYVAGEPVATARLACFETVGEVTGVVTVSEYRRRGFGTAMTWAAIAECARRGCTAITLTASPMGYPVYLRMGFTPVCSYRTYLPPGSAPDDA